MIASELSRFGVGEEEEEDDLSSFLWRSSSSFFLSSVNIDDHWNVISSLE